MRLARVSPEVQIPARLSLILKAHWNQATRFTLMDHTIERVVDLLDPSLNRIYNMTVDEARRRVLSGIPDAVRDIDGSFALLVREGKTIRMARSLDRPMRYFLAKRQEGPALIVADRIDTLYQQLKIEGLDRQFHPSYTRMVPAHYVTEIQLVGCPDPDPTYTRFFTPQRNALPANIDEIGRRYIGALADEIAKWLEAIGQCAAGVSPAESDPINSTTPAARPSCWRLLFWRHRQRFGIPPDLPRDARARHEPVAFESIHAEFRRRP